MGGSAEKTFKSLIDPSSGGEDIAGMLDPGGKVVKSATGSGFAQRFARKGPLVSEGRAKVGDDPVLEAKLKKEAAVKKEKLLRAKQAEAARLATAESDIAERRASALPGRGGRSLLIATSPTGTRAQTLGGV
jgi:hypothetical protein